MLFWNRRLFLKADRASALAELDDALAFGILDTVGEDGRATRPRDCVGEHLGVVRIEEDVFVQQQRNGVATDKSAPI